MKEHNCIIIRYAEVGLKGGNKSDFEKRLVQNIKEQLYKKKVSYEKVERKYSRIIILTDNKINLKTVFGITNYSYAKRIPMHYEDIEKETLKMIPFETKDKTFRVTVQRQDKRFQMDSNVLAATLGEKIIEKTGMKVKLKESDYEFFVEIFEGASYVFLEKIRTFGGLPVGAEGIAYATSDTKADELAAILALKRGVQLIPYKSHSLSKTVEAYNSSHITKEEPIALVVGQTVESAKKLEDDLLILRPLVGYDEKMIEEQLKIFEDSI